MANFDDFSSAAEISAYVDEQWPKIDKVGPKLGWQADVSPAAIEHQNEYRFGVLRAALGAALLRIEELESKVTD